jgi:hypothetical protein
MLSEFTSAKLLNVLPVKSHHISAIKKLVAFKLKQEVLPSMRGIPIITTKKSVRRGLLVCRFCARLTTLRHALSIFIFTNGRKVQTWR